MNEQANKWAERASRASSAEQANESVVHANKRTKEQMAQYSVRRFHIIFTHCGAGLRGHTEVGSWDKFVHRWIRSKKMTTVFSGREYSHFVYFMVSYWCYMRGKNYFFFFLLDYLCLMCLCAWVFCENKITVKTVTDRINELTSLTTQQWDSVLPELIQKDEPWWDSNPQ